MNWSNFVFKGEELLSGQCGSVVKFTEVGGDAVIQQGTEFVERSSFGPGVLVTWSVSVHLASTVQ